MPETYDTELRTSETSELLEMYCMTLYFHMVDLLEIIISRACFIFVSLTSKFILIKIIQLITLTDKFDKIELSIIDDGHSNTYLFLLTVSKNGKDYWCNEHRRIRSST